MSAAPSIAGKHHARLLALAAAAATLFIPLFMLRGFGSLDFFSALALSVTVLTLLGAVLDRTWGRRLAEDLRCRPLVKTAGGALAAVILYGVFWAGNLLARRWFDFAAEGIEAVYGFREGVSVLRAGLLIGLVIGPGEELFWRGALQHSAAARLGPVTGWLVATALYAAVHLGSGNPMLVLAAAVCGLYWGGLYLRTGSLLLVAVSHALWDLMAFLWFPFQ